jgi:hypothetical protein
MLRIVVETILGAREAGRAHWLAALPAAFQAAAMQQGPGPCRRSMPRISSGI